MRSSSLLLAVASGYTTAAVAESASSSNDAYLFANPPDHATSNLRIPTSYESAVLGRRVLALTPLGTLSTVFPPDAGHKADVGAMESEESGQAMERRPPGLAGVPVGLMDYIADCEDSGLPTILAIKIATSFRNAAAGSNVTLSLQWAPRYPPDERMESVPAAPSYSSQWPVLGRLMTYLGLGLGLGGSSSGPAAAAGEDGAYDPVPYSAANLPRFSLLGYLEKIDDSDEAAAASLRRCFVDAHPDARYWLPGNRIHSSEFVRLVVTQVYWIGGFGDRAYIGWIPVEEWRNVTRAEWEAVRLPGEKKGWKEWSVGAKTVGDDDL